MKVWPHLLLALLCALFLRPDKAVSSVDSTSPSADMFAAYTKFQEWHFELHLTETQRSNYQDLLRQDFSKGYLREEVAAAPQVVRSIAGSDWLGIAKFHSDQRQADSIDRSTTEMLNNGTVSGNGLWASTVKEARSGCKSSAYLLQLIAASERPLAGSGNIHDSLFPRQVDALFDWTVFRYTMVTGSTAGIDPSEAGRDAFRKMLVASWRQAQGNPKRFAELKEQVDRALWNWVVWRIADYGHFKRLSPFEQKSQIAEWSIELLPAMPWTKPVAERRVAEFKTYVAHMPDAEVRAQFQRKQKSDQRFANTIAQMQSESAGLQQTVGQMRQSMVGYHVANLNTAENLGDSGYVWNIGQSR